MRRFRQITKLLLIVAALLMLAACELGAKPEPTLGPPMVNGEPPEDGGYPTPLPTYTPIPSPLGSEENPILFGIISQSADADQTDALAQVSSQIAGAVQLSVQAKVYNDYLSLESALQRGELHFVWLQPVEYLLATQKDLVSSIIGVNNLGVSAYGIQYLAHRDSDLEEFYDVGNNIATSSPEHALQQFAGMRPCLTSDDSLAGYWVPLAYLAKSNLEWLPPVQTYSYSANLRALYIQGVCGFTSTYAISADPRSSSAVITEFPDAIEQLPVIWISPAIIPNRALAASKNVDLAVQSRVSDFLQAYARDDSGKTILSAALQYEVSALVAQSDDAFSTLRDLLSYTDVRLLDLVQ